MIYSNRGYEHFKYKNCVKIFYTEECITPDFNECDYSISFEPSNFNDRNLKHEVDFNWESIDLNNKKFYLNRKFCNFIYSQDYFGDGSLLRKKFCNLLSKYKKVDCPGVILNNMDNKKCGFRYKGDWVNNKLNFIKEYKFTIAFENQCKNGYNTEKLIHPLQAHSVPIYYGDPNVEYSYNINSFIYINNFKSLEDAVEYIKYLDNNDTEYLKILQINPLKFNKRKSLEEFLVNIINEKKCYHEVQPAAWNTNENIIFNAYYELSKFYYLFDFNDKLVDSLMMAFFRNTHQVRKLYPILELIFKKDINRLISILKFRKDYLINQVKIDPANLEELCAIANSLLNLGFENEVNEIKEYISNNDSDQSLIKKISKQKFYNKDFSRPNINEILLSWESFEDTKLSSNFQRANVLKFCILKHCVFDYNIENKNKFLNFLLKIRPFHNDKIEKIRLGSHNYGGHVINNIPNDGFALIITKFYEKFVLDLLDRNFNVIQYDECSLINKSNSSIKKIDIDFSEFFKSNLYLHNNNSILLINLFKFDSEFKIYDIIINNSHIFNDFNQIVLDFYCLSNKKYFDIFYKMISTINSTHRPIHIHFNNNVRITCFKDFLVSDAGRITFLRSNFGNFVYSNENFPTSFDHPTDPRYEDTYIGNFNEIFKFLKTV